MSMNDMQRRSMLAELGLSAQGETLTVAPPPTAPAVAGAVASPPEPVPGELPSDEQLMAVLQEHGMTGEAAYRACFDAFKLSGRTHGKALSSPFNKALSARVQMLQSRARRLPDRPEPTGYVRSKARASTTQTAAEVAVAAVVELLTRSGIPIDMTREQR